jgi:hypothetical protein
VLVASTSAVRSVRTGGGNKEPRRSGAAKWEETPSQRDLHSLAESSRCVQLDFAFIPHARTLHDRGPSRSGAPQHLGNPRCPTRALGHSCEPAQFDAVARVKVVRHRGLQLVTSVSDQQPRPLAAQSGLGHWHALPLPAAVRPKVPSHCPCRRSLLEASAMPDSRHKLRKAKWVALGRRRRSTRSSSPTICGRFAARSACHREAR